MTAIHYEPARETAAGTAGRRIASPVALLSAAVETVLLWQQRLVERHQLRGMSEQMLSDIGLSRADIELEARKPFWRA